MSEMGMSSLRSSTVSKAPSLLVAQPSVNIGANERCNERPSSYPAMLPVLYFSDRNEAETRLSRGTRG
jgi:hypothetical protein